MPTYRGKTLFSPFNSLQWLQCELCGRSLRVMVRNEAPFEGLCAADVAQRWSYVKADIWTHEKECRRKEDS